MADESVESTVAERRALLQIGTHTVDGEPLAEWEREFLAHQLIKESASE